MEKQRWGWRTGGRQGSRKQKASLKVLEETLEEFWNHKREAVCPTTVSGMER